MQFFCRESLLEWGSSKVFVRSINDRHSRLNVHARERKITGYCCVFRRRVTLVDILSMIIYDRLNLRNEIALDVL